VSGKKGLAVKPHSSRTCGPNQTCSAGWPAGGSDEGSDRLYWTLAPDALFAVHPSEGQFLYKAINPAFESVLGMPSEKIRGLPISDCMGREDASALHRAFHACLAEAAEVRVHHRLVLGKSRRDIETIVAPICDPDTGSITGLIGSHRPLSKRSSDVHPAPAAHARINAKLLSMQQDIQQRIASDLHDSTCQHLIAASLTIMRLRAALHSPANAEKLCDDIDASIDHALKEIRAFAYLLHPQNLMADGLKATIEQYACGFAARTSLKVTTEITPEVDRLPYKKRCSLLRVIQEALTNVFRHAKATEVGIAIKATESEFRLRVRDNGRGMAAGHARYGSREQSIGVGIPAMRERLQQLGGTLEIRSSLAQRSGTTLYAVVPRHPANKQRSQRKGLAVIKGEASR
jgi:two-component system, NarL family, sensor kinase